jgi:DnaJ family protein A protein 3
MSSLFLLSPFLQNIVYVTVNVSPSLIHRREKENIFTDVEISLSQAVLGGTIKVPGIYDDNVVRIPPGTSSHAQMTLKAKGIKRLDKHGHGDQIIHIKIAVPR